MSLDNSTYMISNTHMQVNAKFSDKTALHCAAAAGRPGVIKLLLEYQADIHAKVTKPTTCVWD